MCDKLNKSPHFNFALFSIAAAALTLSDERTMPIPECSQAR